MFEEVGVFNLIQILCNIYTSKHYRILLKHIQFFNVLNVYLNIY
jgi:hypothetical protein